MLIRSGMGMQLSGSVGGVVASHNKGGAYLRNRSVPVNPNSAAQQAARSAFSAASLQWSNLNSGQRAGWEGYASQTPVVNRLGDSVTLSGFNWCVAINSLRLRAGQALQILAPTTPGLASIGDGDVDALSVASGIELVESAAAVDGGYVVGLSPPLSPGVTFYGGPYSAYLVGQDFDGDAGNNPPNVTPLRYGPLVVGQRRAFRIAALSQTEGKLTDVRVGFLTVVA